MTNKIDKKETDFPEEKKIKGNKPCTNDHAEKYRKQHEKDHFPRKVWPTDSEKKKGPKI
jgi:hypothetical protein